MCLFKNHILPDLVGRHTFKVKSMQRFIHSCGYLCFPCECFTIQRNLTVCSVVFQPVFLLSQFLFSSRASSPVRVVLLGIVTEFTEAFNVAVNLRACLSLNSILASLTHEHTLTDICLEDVGQHDVNNLVYSLTAA